MGTSIAQLDKIMQVLHHELSQILGDQLESVILFGSQARGEAQPDSDVDVLVVVCGTFNYGDLIRRTSALISALSLQYDLVISRAFVSKEQFEHENSPFLLNVRREGVLV